MTKNIWDRINRPLAVLITLNVIFVVFSPFFPFQDMPQHLTYAHIFKNYDSVQIFKNTYLLPDYFYSYHGLYYFLKLIMTIFSCQVQTAFKVLLIMYSFIYWFGTFRLLKSLNLNCNLTRLSVFQLFVWNGVWMMGFVSFALGIPWLFFMLSGLFYISRNIENKKNWIVLLASLTILSLHHIVLVAIGLFLIFLITIFNYRKITYKPLLVVVPFSFIEYLLWGKISGVSGKSVQILKNWGNGWGLEFITHIFKAKWSHLPTQMNYLLWNSVGPYRLDLLLTVSGLFLFAGLFIYYFLIKNKTDLPESSEGTDFKLLFPFLIFLVISFNLPWGIYKPEEVTFINFRFLPIAVFLGCLLIPLKVFRIKNCQKVVLTLMGVWLLIFFRQNIKFHNENQSFFNLIEKIPSGKRVHSLVYQNDSKYFAKVFSASHFLPLYYTIKKNGINSQFWARYTKHLPIDYKKGGKKKTTPDWHPHKFKPQHLDGFSYLLMQENNDKVKMYSTKTKILKKMKGVGCQGRWCLYKKKFKSPFSFKSKLLKRPKK